ncbi:hypothetical protein CFP65_5086 [Kitasatospora sp. MMS16-BH015]|uniref:LysR family transcriptional regulator n=1 Tax=Kitasatospora sp. MMS16-BH015 TaxID=2018025 RepID=UPI000CA2BC82|nr:LysR family transcriptional regulator [Kitasatospora sp. MMS16-BH015]AUG79798.1 hypothetical protein CFP65_5086 [Kitasatospora sp. MMS16-BH015]
MKISQCSAFVAIADTGSFTNAAKTLRVSQSAVSHSIAGLEATLGVALMQRDRGGVRLTEAGRRVLAHARAVLLHAEQMRRVATGSAAESAGVLRIGAAGDVAARLLPRLGAEYRAKMPGGELTLRAGGDRQISDWLRSGAVDLGILGSPRAELPTLPLLREELVLVLPGGHPLAGAAGLGVRQLLAEKFVLPVDGVEPALRTAFRALGREPAVSLRLPDLDELLGLVGRGHGVTVVSAPALPGELPGTLRAVPFAPRLHRSLVLGLRPSVRHTPAVTAFLAAARGLPTAGRMLTAAGPARR